MLDGRGYVVHVDLWCTFAVVMTWMIYVANVIYKCVCEGMLASVILRSLQYSTLTQPQRLSHPSADRQARLICTLQAI